MADPTDTLNAARAKWAKWVIVREMKKRKLTYKDLKARLELIGVYEDERALGNKIARGTFSAAFMCECLAVMGANEIDNDIIQGTRGGRVDCALRKSVRNLNDGVAPERAVVEPDALTDEDAAAYRRERFGDAFDHFPDMSKRLSNDKIYSSN